MVVKFATAEKKCVCTQIAVQEINPSSRTGNPEFNLFKSIYHWGAIAATPSSAMIVWT